MDHKPFAGMDLNGELLCDVDLKASPDSPGFIGSPWGGRSIGYIEEGVFDGPLLRGRVLPGGGDWPTISMDGENAYRVDVRAVWETHDGARIFVQYYGFIDIPEVLRGEGVDLTALDPAAYYFRTAPTFQTADERYSWLNKVLCVGIGRFTEMSLGYRIYVIR